MRTRPDPTRVSYEDWVRFVREARMSGNEEALAWFLRAGRIRGWQVVSVPVAIEDTRKPADVVVLRPRA